MNQMIDPIQITVVVDLPPDETFWAFVNDFGRWWPMAPYSMSEGTLTFDPRIEGRIVETAQDGTAHVWGHVSAWSPARSLGIKWYVRRTEAEATQVRVAFDHTDDGRTGVTLTQTDWHVLGDQALAMRERNHVGWQTILGDHFAAHITQLTDTGKGIPI
jgi:uncharacterized protein YndB with AHSA1/START domain